jgi:hypothetical protein
MNLLEEIQNYRGILIEGAVKKAHLTPIELAKKYPSIFLCTKRYPKAVKISKEQDPDCYGYWGDISHAKNPQLELEKLVVYRTITDNGPDVAYERIGKILPALRKAVNGDILAAYEKNKLYDGLAKIGIFGRKSDKLRAYGDRYYESISFSKEFLKHTLKESLANEAWEEPLDGGLPELLKFVNGKLYHIDASSDMGIEFINTLQTIRLTLEKEIAQQPIDRDPGGWKQEAARQFDDENSREAW